MATSPYTFRADTQKLRKLCEGKLSALKSVRTKHEAVWRAVRDNFEPKIGTALDGGSSEDRSERRGDQRILNSKPRALLHRLAAGLQSGITNQATRWFSLIALDPTAQQRAALKKWLGDCTDTMSESMARGNLYTTLDGSYLHMGGMGQSVFVTVAGQERGDVHNELSDEGDYWISENRRGRVNVLIRRIWMTPEKMVEEFGEGWLDENTRAAVNGASSTTEREVFNLIMPNDGRDEFSDIDRKRAFVSVYWHATDKSFNDGILAVRSYGYNPIIAPRWSTMGSVYGFGRGEVGLGDAEQLHSMERDKLQMIAQQGTPAIKAPASLKGNPMLENYPGGVVWTPDRADGDPGVGRLFDTNPNLQGVLLGIADTEKRLEQTFYADLFAMLLNMTAQQNARQMTAREVSELSSEKISLLGPILTRLNTDLLGPLVDAYFYILFEQGALPPPPAELVSEGIAIGVRYSSALHVEQITSTKIKGLVKVLDVVGMVAGLKPDAVDKLDGDQTIDEVLASTPDSAAVILDDEQVAALREARAQQQQQQQNMLLLSQSAPHIGRGVKDLSESKLNNGSALDAVMASAGNALAPQQGGAR